MHLKYPRKREFFSWEELRCLAKALGFQKDLFYKNVPPELEKEHLSGLNTKILLYMLDMKVLHGDLHRTFNMHDAMYNTRIIEKAVDMLTNKYLSFQELHEVRVAFQLYESEDMLGLAIDERLLMRTLKICGRVVSPAKLMQHIKHMKRSDPNWLLLYELLDLLLLCERVSDVHVRLQPLPSGVDKQHLYKLCDFRSVLTPEDEKKARYLDSMYEQGLIKVPASRQSEWLSWRSEQKYFVDDQPRKELVSRHQQRSVNLSDHVCHSNKKVLHARCGFLGGLSRSTGFVDLIDVDRRSRAQLNQQAIPSTAYKLQTEVTASHGCEDIVTEDLTSKQPERALSVGSSGSSKYYWEFSGTTEEKLSRTSRMAQSEILVTPRDMYNSHMLLENLRWDIETQSERMKQKTRKRLQERYRARSPDNAPSELTLGQGMQDKNMLSANETRDVELLVTPRKQVSKQDSIHKVLLTRLEKTNTLLDFGDVRVVNRLCVSERITGRERDVAFGANQMRTAKRIEMRSLGALNADRESGLKPKPDGYKGDVISLLDTARDANVVSSDSKALFGRQESLHCISAK